MAVIVKSLLLIGGGGDAANAADPPPPRGALVLLPTLRERFILLVCSPAGNDVLERSSHLRRGAVRHHLALAAGRSAVDRFSPERWNSPPSASNLAKR